jgi:hypothetical protein
LCELREVVVFGAAKQQRLAVLDVDVLVAEQLLRQRDPHSLDNPRRAARQLRHDLALYHLTRAHRHRRTDLAERPFIVDDTPMPLETLRGHPDARGSAVGQAFGEAGIISVEQDSGIGSQRVDLDEAWSGHCDDVPERLVQ